MTAPTAKTLKRLSALAQKAAQATEKAEQVQAERDAQALIAYEDGWRRADVAEAAGVTSDRIDQVLRRERIRRSQH